ncbi:MAG: NAD(P)-dependent oxidoreductase [Flavipsychrobacter sp.]
MRILLIGATGFIGSALLDFLALKQEVQIDALLHKSIPQKKLDGVRYKTLSYTHIDLSFLQEGNYDYIFHLGRISVKKSGNIGRWYAGKKGRKANENLLQNIDKLPKKPKLIYLSGSLMYGDHQKKLMDEDTPLSPTGFAKYYYKAEQPFLDAIKNGAENIILLRAPWVLGLGSWFDQIYLNHIDKNGSAPIYGDKDRAMSIISLEDCAGMLWHYAQNAEKGGVFNIYTYQKVLLKDFVNLTAKAAGVNKVEHYPKYTLKKMADKTTIRSILCEILLDTKHKDIFNAYTPLYQDLEDYIIYTIKKYDARKH